MSRIVSASLRDRSLMRSRSRPARDACGGRGHAHRSFAARDGRGDVAEPVACRRCFERARANLRSNLLVRVPERHAVGDERLGRVGRKQQRIGCGGRQPAPVELESVDEHPQRREREP